LPLDNGKAGLKESNNKGSFEYWRENHLKISHLIKSTVKNAFRVKYIKFRHAPIYF